MPRQARFVPLEPLRVQTADAGQPAQTMAAAAPDPAARGSTAGLTAAAAAAAPATAAELAPTRLALANSGRPMPRALANGAIARDNESIVAAIAEVNAELAASAAASRGMPLLDAIVGRPLPRPGGATERASRPAASPSASAGSASTFASAPPPPSRDASAPIQVAETGTGRTGGEDWGVQLGAFRAQGEAERQLLTTALKDVPQLTGGLRRVEAARVQGVTIYRAQFVGLSQAEAQGACEALSRLQTDCLPLAPGI
jgi:D-alanyl-D-alanine carboxypeptidase